MRKLFYSCLLLINTGQAFAQASTSRISSGGPLKPLQSIIDVRHYTIALNVDPEKQSINGYGQVDMILTRPTDTILLDLTHFYAITKTWVNNKAVSFTHINDLVYLKQPGGFAAGKQSVKIEYAGKPPVAARPPWQGGFTWTKDSTGNPWVVINCQMEGGKIYYPCKDHPSDEPNEGADLIITVPKGLSVAGPGLLQNVKQSKGKSIWHWKTNYTISNYCLVFNIGKYKVYKRDYITITGTKVPMEYYVLEEDTAHASKVLDLRARDTRILEKYFGEYPWTKEKIGIGEVPNPGMEHQTMITFPNKFEYINVNGQDYSDNLFHEFGHEWWANKVTNKDWAHMWIQEGINTYAEALFFREAAGETGYDQAILSFKRGIQNKQPVVPGEVANTLEVYTGDIYTKGAYFMHTLRYVLEDSVFFATLKKFITNPDYTYDNFVTTDDVEKFFSSQSGKELKPLFDFYLRTTEKLEIQLFQSSSDTYYIYSANAPMTLPLDVVSEKGKETIQLVPKTRIKITSKTMPTIDPRGWYFKKVILE